MCLWLLSLLATFVAVEGGDTCQQGFLYKERGIPTMTNLPNSEVCQQACSKNKYCSHFSYDLGDCWFLKAASGLKEKATAISGDKYCASSKDFMLDTETPEEKVRRIHEMIANLAHYVEENSQDVNAVKNAGHVKWSSQNGFLKEEGHDNLAKMLNSASMIFANAGGVSAYAGEIPTREDLDWLLTHTTGQEAVTEEIPPEERLPVGGDTPCNNLRGCGAAQGKSFGVGAPWTNAEVKYCLDPQLHLRAKEAALCGIRMISNALPGIRFTNVGSSGSSCSSNPAVFVTSSQSGCWANIGMARSNFFGFGGGQAGRFSHSGSVTNSLHKLQTQNLKWEVVSCGGTPPSARCFHGACVANDLYVVFGGNESVDYSQPLNDLHLLDLRSGTWTCPNTNGEAPSPRFGHKMIHGPDNQIFVFGGSAAAVPGSLHSFKLSTNTWCTVQVNGTPPLERSFHSFDLIGKWGFCFAGSSKHSSISDLYILDVPNMRWARPLYEGQVNVRSHASSVLHDKLIVFGGVRDKITQSSSKAAPDVESHISKKLFFLNVLEVKGGVSEGDFKFKLVTVGDSGVGKSCLLTRFVQDYYSDCHISTIGVDFKTVVTMVKGRLVKLQLWDTAGQERFSVVTGNYYRNSDGFIFVYDATSRASFDHVEQWLGQVQQHHECGPTTIKILVGNKCDMFDELQVTEDEGRAKAEQMGAFFIATSAKTAANVDMAFLTAAQNLVEMRRRQKQPQAKAAPGPPIGLGAPGAPGAQKKNCCQGGGNKDPPRIGGR